jgi:hypothetical protein
MEEAAVLLQSWKTAKQLNHIVTTKYGSVQGVGAELKVSTLSPIHVYLGIPYATAPISELRFMPPITQPPWDGILSADTFAPSCIQTFPKFHNAEEALKFMPQAEYQRISQLAAQLTARQTEDCLYLNIFIPTDISPEDHPSLDQGTASIHIISPKSQTKNYIQVKSRYNEIVGDLKNLLLYRNSVISKSQIYAKSPKVRKCPEKTFVIAKI